MQGAATAFGPSFHRLHLRLDETPGRKFRLTSNGRFHWVSACHHTSWTVFVWMILGNWITSATLRSFFRIKMKKSDIPHIPHCITVCFGWLSTISNAILKYQTGQLHHEQTKGSVASSLTFCSRLKRITSKELVTIVTKWTKFLAASLDGKWRSQNLQYPNFRTKALKLTFWTALLANG